MARQVKATVYAKVRIEEIETDIGAGSANSRVIHEIEYDKTFTSGTTDGTDLDRVYSTDTALTTSPTSLDLRGALASALNGSSTVVMTDLCLIASVNDQTSSGDAQIGGGSNAVGGFVADVTDVAVVKPQGLFLWVAPNGVSTTAGTGDILQAVASTGTVAHKTIVAGRSS